MPKEREEAELSDKDTSPAKDQIYRVRLPKEINFTQDVSLVKIASEHCDMIGSHLCREKDSPGFPIKKACWYNEKPAWWKEEIVVNAQPFLKAYSKGDAYGRSKYSSGEAYADGDLCYSLTELAHDADHGSTLKVSSEILPPVTSMVYTFEQQVSKSFLNNAKRKISQGGIIDITRESKSFICSTAQGRPLLLH